MKVFTILICLIFSSTALAEDFVVQFDTIYITVKRVKTLEEKTQDLLKMMDLMDKNAHVIRTYAKLQKNLIPVVANYKLEEK